MTAADIRDIHGPFAIPAAHPWWPAVLTVVAIAAVAALAALAIRRHRRRAPSADARALAALEAARGRIEADDARGFSGDVSDAVRGYVEAAFGVRAPRLTTDELLASLMVDASPVASHRAELGMFLEYCDLAKYARWSLSRADMTRMLDSAETFVRVTAPGGEAVRS